MGMSDAFKKKKTVQVGSNGKAPSGLSAGDKVVTGGGTYEITGVKADGTYESKLADSNTTTKNYSGTYDTAPTTSSSPIYNNSYASTNGDMGLYAKQQMANGASYEDILSIYNDRFKKSMSDPSLYQYADDDIMQAMEAYMKQAQITEQGEDARNTAYEDLMEWMQNNQQPTYTAKYDPAMEEMLNKILNREDFSYDPTSDPLTQQYQSYYQQEGDRAMRETLANAAASAGGMNSYAITAAQQANNYYASQMANKIPELRNLAYQMYLDDKESMVQDLGLLQGMDATQYNRYRDTMQDYRDDRNFAYGKYLDDVSQGNWEQNFNYGQFVDDRNFNYGVSQDTLNREEREEERETENSRYESELARYEEEQAKAEAQAMANTLFALGQMPDDDTLQKAGISKTEAQKIVDGVKAEQARQAASGGGGAGGAPQGTGGMTDDEILEQAKKDLDDPSLTADALADYLKLGFIRYDEEEGKFKQAMFDNNWWGKEDD